MPGGRPTYLYTTLIVPSVDHRVLSLSRFGDRSFGYDLRIRKIAQVDYYLGQLDSSSDGTACDVSRVISIEVLRARSGYID